MELTHKGLVCLALDAEACHVMTDLLTGKKAAHETHSESFGLCFMCFVNDTVVSYEDVIMGY